MDSADKTPRVLAALEATISDRIGAIGGTLTIHTHPGAGVHIHGHIPT